MTSFWPVLFKIKRAKTMSFWSHKKCKKLGLLSAPCNPMPKKKEKEKEKEEVGDQGALVDHVAPKRCLREGESRRPEPRRAFHNYVGEVFATFAD